MADEKQKATPRRDPLETAKQKRRIVPSSALSRFDPLKSLVRTGPLTALDVRRAQQALWQDQTLTHSEAMTRLRRAKAAVQKEQPDLDERALVLIQ